MGFSGSYARGDVEFLVTPLARQPLLDIATKEHLIQSGQRHYSEILSLEKPPSAAYQALFQHACAANREQLARDCLTLAKRIAQTRPGRITVVSLLRGGTPVGVIVTRLLRQWLGRAAVHYSVSIIRDRGLDEVALRHILASGATAESIVFVDGWVGKGVIARELAAAVAGFNQRLGVAINPGLAVLADLAGHAACAASCNDYLIPSSILNATVSGLVSRSVLNADIGPEDFHGCVYYSEFAALDVSAQFVDDITAAALLLAARQQNLANMALSHSTAADLSCQATEQPSGSASASLQKISRQFLLATQKTYGIEDINLIKPGIGEATRVLLRRVPRAVILRDPQAADVAHLVLLAAEKSVPVLVDPTLPYQAVSLIKSALDG